MAMAVTMTAMTVAVTSVETTAASEETTHIPVLRVHMICPLRADLEELLPFCVFPRRRQGKTRRDHSKSNMLCFSI